MHSSRHVAFALVVGLVAAPIGIRTANAQSSAPAFDFSIKNIMRGPEVYGREPENVRWSADSKWIYFTWLEPGSDWRLPAKPFRVRAEPGAVPERVTDAQMDSVAPLLDQGRMSPDRRTRVVSSGGDLYLIDGAAGTTRRLTETLGAESNPTFSVDGREVYFVRDNNVYAVAIDGGLVRQLTDIRAAGGAAAGEATAGRGGRGGGGTAAGQTAQADTGQRGSLERQQRELFNAIRDREHNDSVTRADQAARAALQVRPMNLMQGERIGSITVSPTGKSVLITTVIPNDRALATRVPNYVTESGYTEEIPGRTKVGDYQSSGRVAFMSLPLGTVRFLHIGDTGTQSAVRVLGWTDDGSKALLFSTSSDFKNRWIHTVSGDSGTLKLLDTLHDSAWVAGPCFGCGGWYDGGRRLYYVSEADGYAHLYTMNADGSDRQQLTKGKWEVSAVSLSRDAKSFYMTTSEQSPFDEDFYRMPVTGGAREKLTAKIGGHAAVLSPDETKIADMYSTTNRPPELYVQANQPNAAASQLTTSPTKEWLSFDWVKPEVVMVPASDGIMVPAHIYRPKDMHASANGAAVIFVHGAGYLQNVMNYWSSSYPREYMFNQYLASKGYVVLDMDYRGSAGYGRDWRTAIYRWMGGRDLQDEVDGSKYLTKQFGIGPERIGMYGGSYGGFMTLMALFTAPKYFGAGAALRPVSDWAHYNHGYTARILNFPDKDTLAYQRSSPIFFAQGLEDPLLILQGMVDTNVNFEDSVRLTQRLIELGKKGWWLMPYPVEDHGFLRPDSWTDEYTRIFTLFETTIRHGKTAAQSAAAIGGGR
ncbi:MAG TPA: prolyl oligopeptidase family serine peptidase [Gemmatimonadaceae bacterium]|jgi:dipeptidyl aminopeptidase/acylaminoacyl peptidase